MVMSTPKYAFRCGTLLFASGIVHRTFMTYQGGSLDSDTRGRDQQQWTIDMRNIPPARVVGELRGRCGALRGEAAMAAIHFEATMEWIRSLSWSIVLRSYSYVQQVCHIAISRNSRTAKGRRKAEGRQAGAAQQEMRRNTKKCGEICRDAGDPDPFCDPVLVPPVPVEKDRFDHRGTSSAYSYLLCA